MLLKMKKNDNNISGQCEIIENENDNILQFKFSLNSRDVDIRPKNLDLKEKNVIPCLFNYFVKVDHNYWSIANWRLGTELAYSDLIIMPVKKSCAAVEAKWYLLNGIRGQVLMASYAVKPFFWRLDIDYYNVYGEKIRLRFVK